MTLESLHNSNPYHSAEAGDTEKIRPVDFQRAVKHNLLELIVSEVVSCRPTRCGEFMTEPVLIYDLGNGQLR